MEEWAFACCVLLRFVQTLIWRLQLFPFCGYTTVSLLRTKTCHSQTRRWVLVLRSLVLRSLVLLALVLRSLVLRILVLRSLVLRILVLRIRLRVRCNTAFWSAPVRVLNLVGEYAAGGGPAPPGARGPRGHQALRRGRHRPRPGNRKPQHGKGGKRSETRTGRKEHGEKRKREPRAGMVCATSTRAPSQATSLSRACVRARAG